MKSKDQAERDIPRQAAPPRPRSLTVQDDTSVEDPLSPEGEDAKSTDPLFLLFPVFGALAKAWKPWIVVVVGALGISDGGGCRSRSPTVT